jgi:hypothetical protein
VLAAVELVEVLQVLLYHTHAIGLSVLTVEGTLPSLAVYNEISLGVDLLEVLIDPVDYRSLLRGNAGELNPLFEPTDFRSECKLGILIEQVLDQSFINYVYVQLRIPGKATTLSGAWRPRDPVDDDRGGARA